MENKDYYPLTMFKRSREYKEFIFLCCFKSFFYFLILIEKNKGKNFN